MTSAQQAKKTGQALGSGAQSQQKNSSNFILLDQVRTLRAEISVLSEEIEINLVKSAIQAVEDD